MLGSKALNFDAYGLFRATQAHMGLDLLTLASYYIKKGSE